MKQLLLCIIISLSLSNCGWYDSYQYTAADGVKVNLVYMPGCGGSSSYQHESKPYSTDSYECSTHDFIKGFYGCATAKNIANEMDIDTLTVLVVLFPKVVSIVVVTMHVIILMEIAIFIQSNASFLTLTSNPTPRQMTGWFYFMIYKCSFSGSYFYCLL